MSIRGKLQAKARGDTSTAELLAFGGSNSAAYDLLDTAPEGSARLAAWCAFVLQTYGDRLLSSGRTAGYATEAACAQAQVLYELTRDWIERAHYAAADPSYALDVSVPQGLPHPMNTPPEADQIKAMKATLEVVQARAGAELAACPDASLTARLQPSMAAVSSAIDAAIVSGSSGQDVLVSVGRALVDGLNRAYVLGQVLAAPALLKTGETVTEPAGPAAAGVASLGVFLPGDAGFDPWCLTDPLERSRSQSSAAAAEKLDVLWRCDPHPEQTLAIQAEIASALEHCTADYLPSDSGGSLEAIATRCPWPGVLYAKEAVLIGGLQIQAGDRFVLAVGGSGASFRRAVVRLPSGSNPGFSDGNPRPHFDASFGTVLDALTGLGLDIFYPG